MMVNRQTQLQVALANAQALQEEGRFAEAERAWLDLPPDRGHVATMCDAT